MKYIDDSQNPRRIKSLNCSELPPRVQQTSVVALDKDIWDLCTVPHRGQELTVLAQGMSKFVSENDVTRRIRVESEVCGFSSQSGRLEWTVRGKLGGLAQELCAESVASDGHGLLFVSDTNNRCVEMFSADGSFMCVFLREGEQGLGNPRMLRWHNNSLLVVHKRDSEFCSVSKVGLRIIIKVSK